MKNLDTLYPKYFEYRKQVSTLDTAHGWHDEMRIMAGNGYEICYAPFDFINDKAKVVIVGITPGEQQAMLALNAMKTHIAEGLDDYSVLRLAKHKASFGGTMRSNLVAMLDHIGLADLLDIKSCAEFFEPDSELAHFTSVLRYPTFYQAHDGAELVNYNGQNGSLRNPDTEDMMDRYFGNEITLIPDALYIPLGPKVTTVLRHYIGTRQLDESQVLDGLPHPSGANAERISYFTGKKSAADCSIKTNTDKIDASKNKLLEKLAVDIFRAKHIETIN